MPQVLALPLSGTYWVQHEEVHSLPSRKGHEGGAAVERVARGHDVAARLQGVLFRGLVLGGLRGRGDKDSVSLPPEGTLGRGAGSATLRKNRLHR